MNKGFSKRREGKDQASKVQHPENVQVPIREYAFAHSEAVGK
jgi:hypothetical protein